MKLGRSLWYIHGKVEYNEANHTIFSLSDIWWKNIYPLSGRWSTFGPNNTGGIYVVWADAEQETSCAGFRLPPMIARRTTEIQSRSQKQRQKPQGQASQRMVTLVPRCSFCPRTFSHKVNYHCMELPNQVHWHKDVGTIKPLLILPLGEELGLHIWLY